MSGGGIPGYDETASQQVANILGQQWRNYQQMYEPIENQQIAYATNPNTIKNAQVQAGATADAGSAAAQQGLTKQLEGQGIQLNPQQQQAVNNRLGLQAGLNKVNAMNQAGTQTYDTITQILSGSAPSSSQITQGFMNAPPVGGGGG